MWIFVPHSINCASGQKTGTWCSLALFKIFKYLLFNCTKNAQRYLYVICERENEREFYNSAANASCFDRGVAFCSHCVLHVLSWSGWELLARRWLSLSSLLTISNDFSIPLQVVKIQDHWGGKVLAKIDPVRYQKKIWRQSGVSILVFGPPQFNILASLIN